SQDGHEAIRPAMPSLEPDAIKSSLTSDQYRLYKLIWQRFAASQMTECVHNTTAVDIAAGDYIFKASDSSVKFNGFTLIYTEGKDFEEEKTKALPKLVEGDVLKLKELLPKQHFTEPPARFNEASLIKALEEYGIGRPSTYAATISTILSREYVKREGKALLPTELGEAITKLMKDHFANIVNVKFTAKMEEELDTIEKGEIEWV
ncbi:MAG: DNA topoisomerase I, partial [Oscillospiraceae bacterium]|nr:DNA topoisomerase I [Oscillospiraceae bacterium]